MSNVCVPNLTVKITLLTFSFRSGKGRTLVSVCTRVLWELELVGVMWLLGIPLDKEPMFDVYDSI